MLINKKMNSIKIIIVALLVNFYSHSQEANPIEIQYLKEKIDLTESKILELKSMKFEVNLIYTFLKENGFSDDNKKWVKEVILLFKNERPKNFTKDDFPGKGEGYPFE